MSKMAGTVLATIIALALFGYWIGGLTGSVLVPLISYLGYIFYNEIYVKYIRSK